MILFEVLFITLKMEGCCSFKALVGGTTLPPRGTSHRVWMLPEGKLWCYVLRNARV